MIGVSAKPVSSSAARMAATRPSIMSLGATMSAPASAYASADLASRFSVASLSMMKSQAGTPAFAKASADKPAPPDFEDLRTMPQWPWLMYSQRQTSQMTMSSGNSFFKARTALGTMPLGA